MLYKMLAEWEGNVGKEGIGREDIKPQIIKTVLNLEGAGQHPQNRPPASSPESLISCRVAALVGVCIFI